MMRSRRVVEVAEAPPKPNVGVAGGLSESDYIRRIQQIAEEIEPLRRALDLKEAVTVRIRIDPRTGRPLTNPRQATVIHADGALADALATMVTVLHENTGRAVAMRLGASAVYVVDR